MFAAVDIFFPRFTGPRILLYHQVEAGMGREMEIGVETFRAQIAWLAAHGEIVDLESAISRREDSSSDSLFVLTFDDGYADVFEHAYPLMRSLGLPFTIYVTTNPVESQVPLVPGAAPLTWDQLSEMVASGLLTLGSHTHRHADLRKLTVAEVEEELGMSDELIEKRLGVRPRHFAYPWGLWARSAELIVAQRYETAALAVVGSLGGATSMVRLPRIPVQQSDTPYFFRLKVRRGLRAEESMRQLLKGYRTPPLEIS